jgi:hypothetical protein
MTTTPNEPVGDDDIETYPGHEKTPHHVADSDSSDADASDGDSSDASDGDSSDASDGDSSDAADGDSSDADATDA